MKNCQVKLKQSKFKRKKIFKIFNCLILSFVIVVLVLLPNITKADPPLPGNLRALERDLNPSQAISTLDEAAIEELSKLYSESSFWDYFTWEKGIDAAWKSAAVGFKKMLANFLNQLAFDTATYLASGDKGQKPMFITDDWGTYLKNTADDAAGFFIEDLGRQGVFGAKFNICEPDLNVKLMITSGLKSSYTKYKPACTFSKMKQNWEKELKSADFLVKFQNMFNPGENDLGQALTLQTGLSEEIDKKLNEAKLLRQTNQGIKDVTDPISGKTKTPGKAVAERMGLAISDATAKEKIFTGNIVADAIDLFFNTLIGKLIDRFFNKGLVTDFPEHQGWNWDDYESQAYKGGIAGAKERFRTLVEPQFGVRGDYNILSELASCPDPTKAGPTNCVITDTFRQAIINRLTVGEAMKQGYLNSGGIFGFTADGLEPPYNEGYPYRSMIILRKFRIIPVGWEVTAQYIKDFGDKTYNLGDMVACYDSADDYEGYFAAWCQGLVDPDWVLKAPLNYCKREGAGPEIISERVVGSGETSELSISRKDTYCADEQACIKENDDGSCQLYGYCAEERRKWQFNGKACEPKYNTCQTFGNKESKTISYLENTLDYGICNIDNVGCKPYCVNYNFVAGDWNCTAVSINDKLYLDKDAEKCESEDEGCHEFIRTKAGVGANLLKNSGFEDFSGTIDDGAADTFGFWGNVGEAVSNGYGSETALKLSAGLTKTIDAGPADYSAANDAFTLSFYAKDCTAGDSFNIAGQVAKDLSDSVEWQYYAATYIYPASASGNQVAFSINTNSCAVDGIKLERDTAATAYGDYRDAGLIYQKLAPDYLNCAGAAPPKECDNFAKQCSAADVNCELYTSTKERVTVPAKTTALDYCPAECADYDGYIQSETVFDSLRDSYFIPETAKTCDAASAGCDQFTNLDEVAKGGEAVEYYSYLRQCVKPTDPAADCAEFYTWEGSDETGYQLRMHNLNRDGNEPAVTEDDSGECDQAIYSLPPTDPAYNPDCREFYNQSGQVYYHLYTRAIACDDNCHPYRRTEKNIDPYLDAATCNAAGSGYVNATDDQFYWDVDLSVCYFCKNNGEWNDESQSCVYMAIPGQGVKCSGAKNGCREYKGNTGNNIRIISTNDFEGSLQGWAGVGGTTVSLSNVALTAGGNSLYASGGTFSASKIIGNLVQKDKSYVLSFIAKPSGASQINFKFVNGAGETAEFGAAALSAGWQLYKINLAALNHNVDAGEILALSADGNFYIDDIRLTEVVDRYYLIKESWNTPDSCYNDITGAYAGPYYNAGCGQYYDRDKKVHYLRQFSQLCEESVVGCEIMIDTHNSSDYNSQTFNAGDPSQVVAPADSFAYVIYDKTKQCNQSDKGCQRLGSPFQYGNTVLYDDIYLKNNPDKYNEILCQSDAVYCGEWTSNWGTVYFKDPGDAVCQWRQKAGEAAASWGWFKKKIKRCDDNGNGTIDAATETNICLDGSDCASGISCISDENDYDCPTSDYKTLGTGRVAVSQPTIDADGNYWAGVCPASQSGCSEYIEPVSRFSVSLLFNQDFSQNVDLDAIADGWSAAANGKQDIKLETNILYILAVEGDNTATVNITNNDFYELDANNNLTGPVNQVSVSSIVGSRASKRFYARVSVSAQVAAQNSAPTNGSKIELKQAAIDYQLKQDLDDSSCNGVVNFEEGCVLFNERAMNGSAFANSTWDADLTVDDGNGVVPAAGADEERDSNILLKVSPDRVCDKWLACRSYIKDEKGNNVCFDIGLCNGVDDNGSCNSFVITNQVNQTYNTNVQNIGNMSGYAKIGYNGSSLKADYYPLGAMEQVGEVADVPNGGFEFTGANNYPIGWKTLDGSWDENKFTVIDNPITAQAEGIGYAPEGRNFLKYSPSANIMESELIDVEPGMEYVLSADMNTINFHPGAGFDSVAIQAYIVTYDSKGDRTSYLGGNFDIIWCESQPQPWFNGCDVALGGGYDWKKLVKHFKIGPSTSKIKIVLQGSLWWGGGLKCCDQDGDGVCPEESAGEFNYAAGASCTNEGVITLDTNAAGWGCIPPAVFSAEIKRDSCAGNVYFDDIKLRPALNNKDNWNTPQTCRLYPESDSLSCDYYEDSGKRQKGWLGYCLEYDRYPGSDDACVLWWPVDKVKGEGIEEGAGYIGKFPVYYCSLTTLPCGAASYCKKVVQTVTSAGQNKYWSGRVYKGSDYAVAEGAIPTQAYTYTSDSEPFGSAVPPAPVNNPYEWDSISKTTANDPLYYAPAGSNEPRQGQIYQYDQDSCSQVFSHRMSMGGYPTETDKGDLGFWDNCVSNGWGDDTTAFSDYTPVYYKPAGFDAYPFVETYVAVAGSPPKYSIGYYDTPMGKYWVTRGRDGDGGEGVEFSASETCSSVNNKPGPAIELIKRLFAQSYGTWQWDGSHYTQVSGQDWGVPNAICPGGIRPNYPNDYCAIQPKIENIKVNSQSDDIKIGNNQFINLTFNSLVDSQQLPLVMYGVDWGDNEYTVVTGVEMRDRPNADNPHSLYHLYSYWDLKAKRAVDQAPNGNANTVYCGQAGASAVNYSGADSGYDCPDDSDCCVVKPGVKIKDNWGWYNMGGYEPFDSWIIVTAGGAVPGSLPPACVPNGCNTNCPDGCTVADDPDCGCQNGNGCCGLGCNNVNDNDCAAVCAPNGCNGVCPAGCTVAQDPDCGCSNGNGCCGIGCNNVNDNDCAAVCAPNGCNANCPASCTVAQDPDCGCLNGNGCCGIGCIFTNDNDCACIPNCACAANTCVGSTCVDPVCGTNCAGTKVTGCACTLTLTAKSANFFNCLYIPESHCISSGQYYIVGSAKCQNEGGINYKYVSCGGNAGTYNAVGTCCTPVAGYGTICDGGIVFPWPGL